LANHGEKGDLLEEEKMLKQLGLSGVLTVVLCATVSIGLVALLAFELAAR